MREERGEVWEVGEVRCIRLLHLMSEPSLPPSVDDYLFFLLLKIKIKLLSPLNTSVKYGSTP